MKQKTNETKLTIQMEMKKAKTTIKVYIKYSKNLHRDGWHTL